MDLKYNIPMSIKILDISYYFVLRQAAVSLGASEPKARQTKT